MKLLVFCTKLTILFLLLTVCSCGGNSQKGNNSNSNKWEGNTIEEDNVPDSMIRVTLDDFTTDSIYVTIHSSNQKKAFSYYEAKCNDQIKGSLTKGNYYSIFPQSKLQKINLAINLTELSGKWFYDMQQHRGIEFDLGGSMSSINTKEVCFKRWMLRNGQFILFYVYMQQEAEKQSQYEAEITEINSLSNDELTFRFKGKMLKCCRMKEVVKFKLQK